MREHFHKPLPTEKDQLDNLESSIEPIKKREKIVRTQASSQAEAEHRAGLTTLGPDLKTIHADQLAEDAGEQYRRGETEIITNEMRDRLAKGEGLALIVEYGWKRFRNIARESELGDVYEQQIKSIETDLKALSELPPLTEEDKREIERLIETKRRQMSLESLGFEDYKDAPEKEPEELPIETTLKTKHPEANGYWGDGWQIKHKHNKIWVDRNISGYPRHQRNPMTRFYISPPIGETYKVFDRLIGELKNFQLPSDYYSGRDKTGQIFSKVELALEMNGILYEAPKLYTGNSIVVYMEERKKGWAEDYQSDFTATVKQELARALRQALTPESSDPHPYDYLGKYKDWALLKYRVMSKANSLFDLTLPLTQDRTVKMVEQEYGGSYHSGILGSLANDMGLLKDFRRNDRDHDYEVLERPSLNGYYDAELNIEQLKALALELKEFEPEQHPDFAKDKRYPNMPSLLTEEAYAGEKRKDFWSWD